MTRNDLKIIWPILRTNLLTAINYFKYKLDRITRIEIAIFVFALAGIFLHRVNLKLYWMLRGGCSVKEAWEFILQVLLFLFLITIVSVFSFTKKSLQKPSNSALLSLPLTSQQFTIAKVVEILLPFSVLFILTFGTVLIFTFKADIQPWSAFYFLVKTLFLILAAQMTGICTAVVMSERARIKHRLNRLMILVSLVFANCIFILYFDHLLRYSNFFFWFFIIASLCVPHILTYWSMNVQLKYCPEVFTRTNKKTSLLPLNKIINWCIFPAAKSLRPIVKKDVIYATRFYKSFLFTIVLLITGSIVGLMVIKETKNAAGWLVFINVLGSYWLTNLSFKFNEESVENFAIIKTLALSAKQYWWGKFFTAFLPVFWIMAISYLFFVFLFGFPVMLTAQSLGISLWICFTLVFFQTNFSLYSYPYARYAPLWYNMYIVLAVLFFTILLFPPLTIAFLFLGYLAIFRVLKRIKTMEVI
jgi:hypothetical protein